MERFAGYHRQSYGGCKVGVGDVLIGAAAVAADYNGAAKASHIKDKLIEMTHLNETLYACGIACSAEGHPTESGNYIIDLLLANVCKQNVTRFPYEIVRLAEDIAGGLMVTAPSEADFRDPTLGPIIDKYLRGVENVSTENRLRILRLIDANDTNRIFPTFYPAGEQGIVCHNSADPHHDRAVSPALQHDMAARGFSGYPFGCPGTGGDFSVHCHGVFHYNKWALCCNVVEKDFV